MRESENAFRPGTYLDVDLVTTQHDRNVLADSLQVSVPVGNVLVGDSGSDVEHDNTTLSCGRRRTGECQLPCSWKTKQEKSSVDEP